MRSNSLFLILGLAVLFSTATYLLVTKQSSSLKTDFDCADVQKIEESGKFVAQNLCEYPQKIIIKYKLNDGSILKEETDCLVQGKQYQLKYFDSLKYQKISSERCFPICQNCD
ncbi:hypothetical protein ABPG74_017957 [Tetrahymena malaccensis]